MRSLTEEAKAVQEAIREHYIERVQERAKTLLDEDLMYDDFFPDDPPKQSLTIFGRVVDVVKGLFNRQ